MRRRYLAILLIIVFFLSANGQTKNTETKFNLDFEDVTDGMPTDWKIFGSDEYAASLDSVSLKNGKYSAFLGYDTGKVDFKAWALTLPDNYKGKNITLSGYIKTENITDGFAGLWMRIDPEVAFDNMAQRGITGTTDWTEYKITLTLNPAKTKQIVVGGLLRGKGKMWLDSLKVTIDGKDLSEAKTFQRKVFPAETDTAFNNGSSIIFPELNDKLIDNLELLGKLWGFLKYHHPAIGKGNYNWDYELFRILPEYLKVTDKKQRDQLLLSWINKYGEIPVCATCKKTPDDVFLKPDLSWITDSDAGKELKSKVKEIYRNRHQEGHYYVGMTPFIGNPQFLNENQYSNRPYPDQGFRLLALYRYWNMIQYFCPGKYLTDKDWNIVLKEYIPLFINARDELEYELAILQLIGEIDDTHAVLGGDVNKIHEYRGDRYAPFRIQFIENKLVVTDYYKPELQPESKLQVGDVITHIAGKPVEKIVDSLRRYYPASNDAAKLRDIANDMLRSNLSTVDVKYISDCQEKETTLTLYKNDSLNIYDYWSKGKDEKCYKLLDGNIGYITLKSIKDEDIPVIKETFKNTKGIIIDIRNYPAAFVPFSLGSYFLKENTPFVRFTFGNINNPGEFRLSEPLIIPKSDEYYQGKLVVIVNEVSQSQSEYTAMAFRAGHNTTIVGSTTAGADGNVSTISLPGGLKTFISGIGIYYPDGTATQRVGIVPDIKIEPTIEGIKSGRDEVLEKAIEVINK
jgi:C-terminal processing protease CtpA/Prc